MLKTGKELDVCSGCSGDYAGGFEDSGDPDNGSDRETMPEHEAINGAAYDDAGVLPVRADGPERSWQVLVSATRIVEIHMFDGIRDEPAECRGVQAGSVAAADYHSNGDSAKYYQSRVGSRENGPDPHDVAATPRNSVAAARKFRALIRSARKAIGELHQRD